jgi:hypothetical protein
MTRTLRARFDGEVLHPEESLSLAPDTRVVITIEAPDDDVVADNAIPIKGTPYSFLRFAQTLNLDGPEDWSERLEDYLYGDLRPRDD